MKEKASAIWSEYIIDGKRMVAAPGDILCSSCDNCEDYKGERSFFPIIDETIDPKPFNNNFENSCINKYLKLVLSNSDIREIPAEYPGFATKSTIAASILSAIWQSGHFKLSELYVHPDWKWSTGPVGNMAAFYHSVESACEYCSNLGIRMNGYSFSEGNGRFLEIRTGLADIDESYQQTDTEQDIESNQKEGKPVIYNKRQCGSELSEDSSSWVIYVPFDPCEFRLGGSLLAEINGGAGDKEPELSDTEYFTDCYEVVRELIEDGIVKSGVSVGSGGLMTALAAISSGASGFTADISGLVKSYSEDNLVRILFGEIPGVVIEIEDSDYDYIDAEFLLQDVAYYPLGHPCKDRKGLRISKSALPDISGIMQSLLSGQTSEGED